MDDVIVDLLRWARQLTREIDPAGKIGFEGMFRSYSECGYDMEHITEICDFLVSYEYPYRWEMLASFAADGGASASSAGKYYGVFSNSLGGDPVHTRYQVWKAVFHGLNSIWWWRISGESGFLSFDLGVGANPNKYEAVRAQAAQIAELRQGIARLLHRAERTGQPVGILHSQTSLHMTKYDSGPGGSRKSEVGGRRSAGHGTRSFFPR